ncbi:unnamed protein product [Acanthoscelides obtectus]|uniref:Kinesin motor domain-containing protein n=1 Tax=Acanthoscelides obtectus TaxID=200917 RepID=A0A9P0P034_ACAOB|nr:unnamed protein product [Acanthoscelides obtectus]CAK1623461.1 Protein claret segregational [Acanthoscelides obtectus]
MQGPSKLPLLKSGIPRQQFKKAKDDNHVSKTETTENKFSRYPHLKRRSKSTTDLLATNILQPLRPLQSIIEKRLVNGIGGSTIKIAKTLELPIKKNVVSNNASKVVPASSSKVASASTKQNGAIRRQTQKRAAPKTDDQPKAKVVKAPEKAKRVASWDFKTKFQLLNEKHGKLLNSHKELQEKFSNVADYEQYYQKYNEIQTAYDKQTKDYEKIAIDYTELKSKYEKLVADHNSLSKTYDEQKTLCATYADQLRTHEDNLELKSKLIEKLSTENNWFKQKALEWENERRALHNTIFDLKGNIRVFCRVRPAIGVTEDQKLQCMLSYPDEYSLEIRKTKESISATSGKPIDNKADFCFDKVFSQRTTQEELFQEIAPYVQSAVDGYDVCVFAYGQTGSGKTYTMLGEDYGSEGVIPRTVSLIFRTVEGLKKTNWEYEVHASVLEIYNENLRDLLSPTGNQNMEIRHNCGRETTVTNLTIEKVENAEDLRNLMELAQKHRTVAATNYNEHSSSLIRLWSIIYLRSF